MTADASRAPFLLVADPAFLRPSDSVWGTGGWLHPRSRTALDWLCLARSLGWEVDIVSPDVSSLDAKLGAGPRWIVVGCETDLLTEEAVAALGGFLEEEPALVIGMAASAELPWSRVTSTWLTDGTLESRDLTWSGSCAEQWTCRRPLLGRAMTVPTEGAVWARLGGTALIAALDHGRGTFVNLAFDPSEARDASGCATALLRKLLVCASFHPVAWFDLSHTLALRMDDPGAGQSAYLASWSYPQLDLQTWGTVVDTLSARGARLSVGYVSGWVDDGDPTRGALTVGGRAVSRVAGRIHPSAEVVYSDLAGHRPGCVHDYAGQVAALREGHAQGWIDIELHGYTHMHPDTTSWASASDRYTSVRWFREFGRDASSYLAHHPERLHPVVEGQRELRRRFGIPPSTLIFPGDDWSHASLEAALDAGLQAISSYYFAFRFDDRWCWSQHICAPYLDEPEAAWFDSGLPVVGYFHDADLARNDPQWLGRWLDAWSSAGALEFLSLRQVAAAHRAVLRTKLEDGTCTIEAEVGSVAFSGVQVPVRYFIPKRSRCTTVSMAGGMSEPAPRGSLGALGGITMRLVTESGTARREQAVERSQGGRT